MTYEDYQPQHRAGEEGPKPFLTNERYDALVWIAQVFLPGLATFYATVAGLTPLPWALEVSGIIMALDTFLGLMLGIQRKNYQNSDERFDGLVVVHQDGEGGADVNFKMEDTSPLADKDEVTFKVARR